MDVRKLGAKIIPLPTCIKGSVISAGKLGGGIISLN